MHYDLERCHQGASTDVNEQRSRRRAWQRRLNAQILNITLELIVNIFRYTQQIPSIQEVELTLHND